MRNLMEKWKHWKSRLQPRKAVVRSLNCIMIVMFIRLMYNFQLDIAFGISCLIVSGGWIALTAIKMRRLIRTYFSLSSRAQLLVPLICCIALDLVAMVSVGLSLWLLVALAELMAWFWIGKKFKLIKYQYEKAGAGPVPSKFAINPTPQFLPSGTVILTPGDINNAVGEAIGHVELLVRRPDGTMVCLSSWMGFGIVINAVERITKGAMKLKNGFYIALIPLTPLTREQEERLYEIFMEMKLENRIWRYKMNYRRRLFIRFLPIPRSTKSWLVSHTRCSGYDWLGLFIGRRRKHAWTCIGSAIEAYSRLGIPIMQHRTGALGLGTGLDLINPEDIVDDIRFTAFTKAMESACQKHLNGNRKSFIEKSSGRIGRFISTLAANKLVARLLRIFAPLNKRLRQAMTKMEL